MEKRFIIFPLVSGELLDGEKKEKLFFISPLASRECWWGEKR
jgi:hypothetical protein